MKTKITSLTRLLKNDRGNVAMTYGLLLAPMIMLTGSAVDIGTAIKARTELQSAADAAALAAAGSTDASSSSRILLAETLVHTNLNSALVQNLSINVGVAENTTSVDLTGSVSAKFLGIAGMETIPLAVHAKAQSRYDASDSSSDLGKICILALDPDAAVGFKLFGNPEARYPDCWAYTNAKSATAIASQGSKARASGEGHCAVGGASIGDELNFTPEVTTGCKEAADPFATVGAYSGLPYVPAFVPPVLPATCKAQNLNLKKNSFTLDPGRYCGGISMQAKAKVKLNPGVYVIDSGVLNVQSGATLTGDNVLLYFTGTGARMQIIGGGTVDLKGRSTGQSYAGFLSIADTTVSPSDESNIQGGGSFRLEGIVYNPLQHLVVTGAGESNASSKFFGIIAKSVQVQGNGEFHFKKHDGSSTLPNIMPDVPRQNSQEARLIE